MTQISIQIITLGFHVAKEKRQLGLPFKSQSRKTKSVWQALTMMKTQLTCLHFSNQAISKWPNVPAPSLYSAYHPRARLPLFYKRHVHATESHVGVCLYHQREPTSSPLGRSCRKSQDTRSLGSSLYAWP